MKDVGPTLTKAMQKHLKALSDKVVAPMLTDIDALERDLIVAFKKQVQTDPDGATAQFTRSMKKLQWVRGRVEHRYKRIERVIMNGF